MQLAHLNQIEAEGLSHDADITKRVLFSETDMPASVRLSHAALKPGQHASAHSHAGLAEVFYVISGSGEMIVDDVRHPIGEGSAIRVDAGETHALINTGDDELCVVYFALRV
jgi:mannose-6-phosphate isomerase-like protein (cupin superfamily)